MSVVLAVRGLPLQGTTAAQEPILAVVLVPGAAEPGAQDMASEMMGAPAGMLGIMEQAEVVGLVAADGS